MRRGVEHRSVQFVIRSNQNCCCTFGLVQAPCAISLQSRNSIPSRATSRCTGQCISAGHTGIHERYGQLRWICGRPRSGQCSRTAWQRRRRCCNVRRCSAWCAGRSTSCTRHNAGFTSCWIRSSRASHPERSSRVCTAGCGHRSDARKSPNQGAPYSFSPFEACTCTRRCLGADYRRAGCRSARCACARVSGTAAHRAHQHRAVRDSAQPAEYHS